MSFNHLLLTVVLLAGFKASQGQQAPWIEREKWIDPKSPASLTLTTTATGPLRVGDVVNYTCTGNGMPNPSVNLQLAEVIGDYQMDIDKDRSPLVFTKVIEASDNGKQLLCHSQFFDMHDNKTYIYYLYSEKLVLNVEGVTTTPNKPIFTLGQGVKIESNATVTSHLDCDVVEYTCEVLNMGYAFLEVRQVKGPYQMKVDVSAQPFRRLTWTLDTSDDGTSIYCLAFGTGPSWTSYSVESEHMPINVS